MAENETQDQVNTPEEPQDDRQGYIRVATGSTKHPEAKESEDGRIEAVIGVFVGDTLKEAVEKYGEDFVHGNYVRSVVVASQGKVRRELDQGTPVAAVEQEYDDLDPTEQKSSIQDPQAQAMRAFNKLDPEKKKQLLAAMQNSGS